MGPFRKKKRRGELSSPLLENIRSEIVDLAGLIGATRDQLPTFERSQDGARPHIEDSHGELSYVVQERGKEIRRDSTRDENELLYWVFESVAFGLASTYELEHRVEGQDFRIILFQKQMELLRRLSRGWEARWRKEHAGVLRDVGLA